MRFDPNASEQPQGERKTYPLAAPGRYRFGVAYAADKTSSKGNQMIQVRLELLDATGVVIGDCWDNLGPREWMVVAFCKSVGARELLSQGNITANDCKRRQGWCEIEHEFSPGYPTKAKVKSYLYKKYPPANAVPATASATDDDIPF